jgi:nucleoside-diphosphate-sugar epimerase
MNLTRRFKRKRVLIVGCGNVGLRMLSQSPSQIMFIAANRAPQAAARQAGAQPVALQLDAPLPQRRRIAALADWVVYLAPPPNQGMGDPRLARFLAAWRGTGKRLVYVSTSGVYGDCGGAWVDESRPVNPQSERAKRRVAAEQQVRALARSKVATVTLRAPGIYSEAALPLERLRAGTPALAPHEDVYSNHIHADDLARICTVALFRLRAGRVINASDDSHMKMGDYFDLVASAVGLPRPPRLPAAQVQAAVSPMLWSFMRESRRLRNVRLKQELRVQLRYPTVQQGVQAAVRK